MLYVIIFHGKKCYANAAQYDITHSLSILYFIPIYVQVFQVVLPSSWSSKTVRTTCPAHPILLVFDHRNNIWRKLPVMTVIITQLLSLLITRPILDPNICVRSQIFIALNSNFMAVSYEQHRIATKLRIQCQNKFWTAGRVTSSTFWLKCGLALAKFGHFIKIFIKCKANFVRHFVGVKKLILFNLLAPE